MKKIKPLMPTRADWQMLVQSRSVQADRPILIDVIVPVYEGLEETTRCLYSVCASNVVTPFSLVVINDRSPNEKLVEELAFIADLGLIELHHNETNLGFVGTVNRGMRLHPDRDVLLLNSDTEVYGTWLDKIYAHATAHADVGTVTPLSNNAEICSYPRFVEDNNYELEVTGAELDILAEYANRGMAVDAPTGVGFCMYIKRACLRDVGYFDQEAFGRGYGEENDFCQSALLKGYRNSILTDTYVRHYGSTSFGAEKSERANSAMEQLLKRHPNYRRDVFAFIDADPLLDARRRMDIARLRNRGVPIFCFMGHQLGGGTERHVQDMKNRIEAAGEAEVLILRPRRDNPDILYVDDWRYPNFGEFRIKGDIAPFVAFLTDVPVSLFHVHQLVGADVELTDFIRAGCSAANVPYDFTAHDYFTYCPRIHLSDEVGLYCGEPAIASCEACVSSGGYMKSLGATSVWRWRQKNEEFLASARKVFVPNPDGARRLRRQFPRINPVVREHIEPQLSVPAQMKTGSTTPRRRPKIGLLGAIGPHKGSRLLSEVAEIAKRKALELEFVVIGYTDRDRELRAIGNVNVTGAYRHEELASLFAKEAPDIVWLASTVPETFSYTLSEVLANGIWPVAFDFGATAERIRRYGVGSLIDYRLLLHPEKLLTELHRHCTMEKKASFQYEVTSFNSIIRDYYGLELEKEPARNDASSGPCPLRQTRSLSSLV